MHLTQVNIIISLVLSGYSAELVVSSHAIYDIKLVVPFTTSNKLFKTKGTLGCSALVVYTSLFIVDVK